MACFACFGAVQVLMDLARVRNSIPLPPLRDTPGISLPPEADTLLQPNYQISLRANAREENGEGVWHRLCLGCMGERGEKGKGPKRGQWFKQWDT